MTTEKILVSWYHGVSLFYRLFLKDLQLTLQNCVFILQCNNKSIHKSSCHHNWFTFHVLRMFPFPSFLLQKSHSYLDLHSYIGSYTLLHFLYHMR